MLIPALVAAVCWIGTVAVFSPGFLTRDSVSQLMQAQGREPLTDWHPAVMSLLWRGLIDLTGSVGSILVLQLFVLWAALGVLSWALWNLTGRWQAGLAVFGVGLAPQVLTISGVIWKDIQMAFVLLAAVAVALAARWLRPERPAVRWALLAGGVLLLAYAVMVRKNAFVAVLPVFFMLVVTLWPRPGRRIWALTLAALLAAVVVPTAAISVLAKPAPTSQSAQIMLDDMLMVMPADALAKAAETPGVRDRLVAASALCKKRERLSDTYWTCWDVGPGLTKDAAELQSIWLKGVLRERPLAYVQYRAELYSTMLFRTRLPFQPGLDQPEAGVEISHPRLAKTLENYVTGAVRDLPMLFQGWFWLLVGVVFTVRPGRGMFRMPVRMLGISAAVYILAYIPVMPAADYRYVYWPAIAGTLGGLLWLVGRKRREPEPEVREEGGATRVDEPVGV
ncbi:hypothetical protein [Streptomyces sp. NPDC051561]|uniref:hypothetical protein n=1 Tax=Streptomyces sp. NPDC051561 TaxID=3365658 RepID=UPI003788CA5C